MLSRDAQGEHAAAEPQAYSLYCALMRLAAVPSTAGRRRSVWTTGAAICVSRWWQPWLALRRRGTRWVEGLTDS